jgi:hypothetical protein
MRQKSARACIRALIFACRSAYPDNPGSSLFSVIGE